MMCSNSYLNHYIKVGQLPKCVISSIEMAGQPLVKRAVSSAKICMYDLYNKNTLLNPAIFDLSVIEEAGIYQLNAFLIKCKASLRRLCNDIKNDTLQSQEYYKHMMD